MTRKNIRLHNRIDTLQDTIHRLLITIRNVRLHRDMNAAEPPAVQDSWDRLKIAVLEAERILQNADSPRKRPLPGALRSKILDKPRK